MTISLFYCRLLYAYLFKVLIEVEVASKLRNLYLVRVPKFCESRSNIVLVGSKDTDMLLSTSLTDESAKRYIEVSRLLLLAVDAVCIELVFANHLNQFLPLLVR